VGTNDSLPDGHFPNAQRSAAIVFREPLTASRTVSVARAVLVSRMRGER